jgi:hypothetical protein
LTPIQTDPNPDGRTTPPGQAKYQYSRGDPNPDLYSVGVLVGRPVGVVEEQDALRSRPVAAERRRCERKGFIFDQPSCDWREEEYGPGDLVKLGNVNGPIATYRVRQTGRIARVSGAEGGVL